MPIHFQIFDQTSAKMKRVNSKNAPAKLSKNIYFKESNAKC